MPVVLLHVRQVTIYMGSHCYVFLRKFSMDCVSDVPNTRM